MIHDEEGPFFTEKKCTKGTSHPAAKCIIPVAYSKMQFANLHGVSQSKKPLHVMKQHNTLP